MKRRLSVTNLSSENNLPTFRLNAPVVIRAKGWLMMTAAFSRNVWKLFSELKLVTDNLLFIYAEANWEAAENLLRKVLTNSFSHHQGKSEDLLLLL